MRKGYLFFRCLGYLAGILGAVCLFVLKEVSWAEQVGMGLLGLMFVSFLLSFVVFVWLKLDFHRRDDETK